MQLVRSGSTAININGEVGPFFQASRGVKQGDPISPLLFNLAVDALAGILDKARLAGHIQGVVGHLIQGGGVSHLQYVDDTMIMVSGSDSDIANLKFLLLCFEEMSGLKINFDKSEVVVLGYFEAEQHRIADNLNCKLASFPISYLGMPLAESRILVSGFNPLVGRVASRAEPWCGRLTSKGSKSILISSNLASLPMYMMGMYILPEGVHNAFDKELARFFWQARNVVLVSAAALEDGWHVTFRRPLGPVEVLEWELLLAVIPLPTWAVSDSISWSLSPSGEFSVSSTYLALCRMSVLSWLSPLWKAPLPLKIKIFVWQLLRDCLLSGTEVLKRHGPGNGICPLCHVPETGSHILFSSVAAQALWCFVREALGPEWEASDLADFL
ncbi:retrotransposon protein [Hordeum vulgare]|nr:retrotransposon protein [Hordeum vulgare]